MLILTFLDPPTHPGYAYAVHAAFTRHSSHILTLLTIISIIWGYFDPHKAVLRSIGPPALAGIRAVSLPSGKRVRGGGVPPCSRVCASSPPSGNAQGSPTRPNAQPKVKHTADFIPCVRCRRLRPLWPARCSSPLRLSAIKHRSGSTAPTPSFVCHAPLAGGHRARQTAIGGAF